jgi:O-succinylbenzoic acid--CoA ligase
MPPPLPADLVRHAAQAAPAADALVTPRRAWSYAALEAAVAAAARRLRAGRVTPGTRVAVLAPPDARTVVLLWALWRVGAVAAPLSLRLPPDGVARQHAQIAAHRLVVAHLPSPAAPSASALRAALPAAAAVTPRAAFVPEGILDEVDGDEVDGDAAGLDLGLDLDLERDATLVFTSGSTGTPKAALHTLANHVWSARGAATNLPLAAGHRWLLSLPLYHVGGLAVLVRCALAGAAVALPDAGAAAAGGSAVAEGLRATRATHVSLVATQLARLLEAVPGGLEGVEGVLLGGSALPAPLLRTAHARGWPLHVSYGSTEMASQVATTAPGAPLAALTQTAGRVLPHRAARLDATGQLLVRGRTLFRGYARARPDGTLALDPARVPAPGSADPGGWFPTGDRARFDARERLVVTGRADRLIISGGENVQPEEVEAALEALPGVVRAVVVPVPHRTYGARPVAFVQTTGAPADDRPADDRPAAGLPDAGPPGEAGLPRDWRARLARTLPRFKLPDAVYPLPAHALDAGLKPDRAYLTQHARERYAEA